MAIYSSAPRASIVGPGSPDSGTVHSLRLVPPSRDMRENGVLPVLSCARKALLLGEGCVNHEGRLIVKSSGMKGVRRRRR